MREDFIFLRCSVSLSPGKSHLAHISLFSWKRLWSFILQKWSNQEVEKDCWDVATFNLRIYENDTVMTSNSCVKIRVATMLATQKA